MTPKGHMTLSPPSWHQRLPPNTFAPLIARAQAQPSLVPLHLGDAYAPPPQEVLRAIAQAAENPRTYRYQKVGGHDALRASVLERLRRNDGLSHSTFEQVLITQGATQGIFCAAHLLCEPGDEILVLSPYYPLIPQAFSAASAVPVEVPFYGLHLDGEDVRVRLARHLSSRTRAIAVTNPNNPDGTVLGRSTLEQIVAFAVEHDLWILSDESYEEVRYSGAPEHVPTASLPGASERVFTVSSFSKSYGLCGLRLGYALVPSVLAQSANDTLMLAGIHPSNLAQYAALAALEVASEHGKQQRERYERSRDIAVAALEGVCDFAVPDGATYLFLDLSRHLVGRTMSSLMDELITHANVLLAPGGVFGKEFGSHARLCFSAVPAEELSQACIRLRRSLLQTSDRVVS